MKCNNCGAEFEGKFCTNCGAAATEKTVCSKCGAVVDGKFCIVCGTPAPNKEAEENTSAQNSENVSGEGANNAEPVQYQPDFNANGDFSQGSSAPNVQPQQADFGTYQNNPQTTAPDNGYMGQQYNAQGNTGTNGKKPMSGGKIAAIVVSIVLGLLIILGIIFGVVACQIVKGISEHGDEINSMFESLVGDEYSALYDYDYDRYFESSQESYYVSGSVYDEATGFYYRIDDNKAVITDVDMDTAWENCLVGTTLTIPSKLGGKQVEEIDYIYLCNQNFDGTKFRLVIPGTIKEIENYSIAVYNDDVNEIILEDGVEEIGDYAFSFCEEPYKITVPASVTDIGDYAFGFDSYNEKTAGCTLVTEKGSAADSYAKKNGITVEYK